MEWFRAYHGISSDPKWRLIARKANVPVATVVAVWLSLLDYASQADVRGSVGGVDTELLDCNLDLEDGTTQAVMEAMEAKGVIHEGQISAWDKRQPVREDTDNPEAMSNAERSRKCRAKQRQQQSAAQCSDMQRNAAQKQQSAAQCSAPDTDTEKDTEEKYTPPLPPSPGGGACDLPPAPLSGEDIAEAQDAVRQEHRRGDYEFSLLRDAYDKARQEGPRAGRQEFLALFHSPEWPGIDELVHAVEALCAEDDQFRRGFAPGLGKFLREGMWRMKPRAPAGEKPPEASPEKEAAKKRLEELQAKLKAQKKQRRT